MKPTDKISTFVTYKEATHSNTAVKHGIDNTPDEEQLLAMKTVATDIHTPLRLHFGVPIPVTSFFRSKELNAIIGGSSGTSQHMKGQAMDLDMGSGIEGVTNFDLFEYIRQYLEFDQMIFEYGTYNGKDRQPDWVHVSFKNDGSKNRKQILRSYRNKAGKVQYVAYK